MKRILILDNTSGGHHASYLRWILESGAAKTTEIAIAAPAPLIEHTELAALSAAFTPYRLHFSDEEKKRLDDFSFFGLVRREFTVRAIYARAYKQVLKDGQIDMVLLPFVDDCMNAISLIGSPFANSHWSAINMRAQFHLHAMGLNAPKPAARQLRELLFKRLLGRDTFSTMFTLDPTLLAYGHLSSAPGFGKLRFLPDPSENYSLMEQDRARELLGLPAHAIIVLAYGALSARKGVPELMSAMVDADCPRDVHVLLAGVQDGTIRRFAAGPVGSRLHTDGRLHTVCGYISKETVALLLSAANAMWLGYVGFYTMSSALVLAARHGLVGLISEEGVMGYLAKKHMLGLPVTPSSRRSIILALQRLSTDGAWLPSLAARGQHAFAHHSVEHFRTIFRDFFESPLGGAAT